MRRLAAPVAVLAVACTASAPQPAPPVIPGMAPPPPVAGSATADPAPAPSADEGPPPAPPMAMRWTFHLPSFEGQPWKNEHLKVTEDGTAEWESEGGEGDSEVDEELAPKPKGKTPPLRCQGHVGPILHRRLVTAAQKAMAAGCTQKATRRVDFATTTMAVTWEGEIKSCDVGRAGGGYAAFEKVRAEVIDGICRRP
jgi:hypothetical protein